MFPEFQATWKGSLKKGKFEMSFKGQVGLQGAWGAFIKNREKGEQGRKICDLLSEGLGGVCSIVKQLQIVSWSCWDSQFGLSFEVMG